MGTLSAETVIRDCSKIRWNNRVIFLCKSRNIFFRPIKVELKHLKLPRASFALFFFYPSILCRFQDFLFRTDYRFQKYVVSLA